MNDDKKQDNNDKQDPRKEDWDKISTETREEKLDRMKEHLKDPSKAPPGHGFNVDEGEE